MDALTAWLVQTVPSEFGPGLLWAAGSWSSVGPVVLAVCVGLLFCELVVLAYVLPT